MMRAYQTRAGDLPDAIAWHEGMLLAPQHFQQLTRRQEALLHFHAMTMAPHHWGVRVLNVDRVLLVRGLLRMLDLEAILPDGLVVTHMARQGSADLEVDLTPYAEALKERALTVHLAVAGYAGPSRNGALERYESYPSTAVIDETTGERSINIPRTRPRMHLIVGDEVPEKYVSLPLAKIRHQNEGYVRTDYVPPSLFVEHKMSLLGQICDDVSVLLREKATFLAEQVHSPATLTDTQMMLKRHQIQSMVGTLAQFEAVLRTDVSHPFLLYLAFCNLAGHVAAVGQALIPPVFEPYDHNDLLFTFNQVRAFIERVIEEGIQQTHEVFVFTREENRFHLRFREPWFERKLVLGVRGRSGMSDTDTVAWIHENLICTESHLEGARKRRVLGLARKQVPESDGLVPGRGMVLFELEADRDFIVAGEHLVVMRSEDRPGEERPVEILLYVKNENNGKGEKRE